MCCVAQMDVWNTISSSQHIDPVLLEWKFNRWSSLTYCIFNGPLLSCSCCCFIYPHLLKFQESSLSKSPRYQSVDAFLPLIVSRSKRKQRLWEHKQLRALWNRFWSDMKQPWGTPELSLKYSEVIFRWIFSTEVSALWPSTILPLPMKYSCSSLGSLLRGLSFDWG